MAQTGTQAPASPEGFTVTAGDGEVELAWTDPVDDSITGWEYRQKVAGGNYGEWTPIPGSGAARYTVGNLDNGETYVFRVRAVNAFGNGAASDEATATPAPAPAKPKGFTATAGDGRVKLAWTDPGDASITGWEYRQKVAGGNYGEWTPIPKSKAATAKYAVENLDNGVIYVFQVRAVNAFRAGRASNEFTTMPGPAPAKPGGVTATGGDGEVVLAWTDPGDASITGWQYRQKVAAGDYGEWTPIPKSKAATAGHTVKKLANGKTYTFRVRAVNAFGNGAPSVEATATMAPVTATMAPAKPKGFTATGGDGEVVLAWTDPGDASITGWEYRQKVAGGDYGKWTPIPKSKAATAGRTVKKLDNGETYVFRVRAVNAIGNGAASDEATATMAPAKPGGFTATGGDGEVVLAWTDPGDASITGWQYRQKAGDGDYGEWTPIPKSKAATAGHTVKKLDNGETYTFRVRAVNAGGNGAASDGATVTMAPAKPGGFTATGGDGEVVLAWTDPGDASITGWEYRQKVAGGNYGEWTPIPKSKAATAGHTVKKLDNGETYTFRVRAVNAGGNGAASGEATATMAPAKPGGFTATGGDGEVVLAWTDPGDASITGWEYRQKVAGGDYGEWTPIPKSKAATAGHTVKKLDNGETYTFRVRAVNAGGNGAASGEATATMAPAPAKPKGFTATGGDGEVVLAWTDPGDASITGWEYRQKVAGGDYGEWTPIPKSKAATAGHTVKKLDNGETYTFRVRAVNAGGNGAASGEATATMAPAPAKPKGFTATGGDGEVVLAWTDPGDASITGWEYRQKVAGGDYGEWTPIPKSKAATAGHTVKNLANGKTYTFRVRAVNAGGNGAPSVEATATMAPAKPKGFTATGGDGEVALAWTDPGDASITGWEYRQKAGDGNYGEWTPIPNSGAITAKYTVENLDNGVTYVFRVRAVNAGGNGAASDEATAWPAPPPAKPKGFTATGDDGYVVLAWTDPGDDSITGWQYRLKVAAGDYGEWTHLMGIDIGLSEPLYVVSGLDNGVVHVFQVRAVNGAGDGAASDEATATPAVSVPPPAKPKGFTATGGDGAVKLAWTGTNNSTIERWEYRQKVAAGDYGEWTPIPNSGDGTAKYTVKNLDNGETYVFRVRAVNAAGNGAASDEATATPAVSVPPPAKPKGFTATGGDGAVKLAWTGTNNSTIERWEYRQKVAAGDYGEWTPIPNSGDGTAKYTVKNLDNGETYVFRVRAVNAAGNGAPSDEATATMAPAKPGGFTATGGDGEVALAWTDPGDDSITGWQYRQKVAGGDYGEWTHLMGTDIGRSKLLYVVIGLDNGVVYVFQVRAVNGAGGGAASDEATATMVPAKPKIFTATGGDGEVKLAWTDPGDASITGWQYRQKVAAGNYGEWTPIPDSGAATAGHTVENLDNGKTYVFQVRAVNAAGNGAASVEATATSAPPPAKPEGFTASGGDGRVRLAWTDPNNGAIQRWEYRQKTADGTYAAWAYIPESNAATARYAVRDLDNGETYVFRVRAVNAAGNGAASDEATAATVPAKPKIFTATAGYGRVVLAWRDPRDDGITGWQYRQKVAGGGYGEWTPIPKSNAATAGHTVEKLDNGVVYVFRVRAVNATGNGVASDEALTGPIPSRPEGLTATGCDGEVVLAWADPNNGTIQRWEYREKVAGGGNYGEWTPIPKSNATTVGHTVEKLDNGETYVFQLRAVNAFGSGAASDEATAARNSVRQRRASAVPAQPENLRAVPGNGLVRLQWRLDPDGVGIAEWWQYRQKVAGGDYGDWIVIPNSDAATATMEYTVENLDNGKTYVFRVRAVNATRTGTPSAEATALVGLSGLALRNVVASPASIDLGESSTIAWMPRADVARVRIRGGGLFDIVAQGNEHVVTPTETGAVTYTLSAEDYGGAPLGDFTVTVEVSPMWADAPALTNVMANPQSILLGESSTIAWTPGEDATRVYISGGGLFYVVAQGNEHVVTPTETGAVTYTLSAEDYEGAPLGDFTVTVEVSPMWADAPALTNVMANPQSILLGESSTIAWTPGEDATRVYISGGGLFYVVAQGNEHVVTPTETGAVTYTLSAEDYEGAPLGDFTVTVKVSPMWADAPALTNVMANPQSILLGESSTIAWTPREDVARVYIGGGGLFDIVAQGNEHVVAPTETGAVTYTLSAEDYEGAPLGDFTVTVEVSPMWADAPALTNVMANPQSILLGESSTIAWTPGEDATRVYISGGGLFYVVAQGNEHVVTPTETGAVTYTLSAEDYEGAPLGDFTVTVKVSPMWADAPALTNVMANPQSILLGESSTIAWTPREDVARVYIGGGGLFDIVAQGNEHVVAPTETGAVTYTLSAEDIEGAPLGDFTVEVTVTQRLARSVPARPKYLEVMPATPLVALGRSAVRATWSAASVNTELPILAYELQYWALGSADWLDGPTVAKTEATLDGLDSNSVHEVRVRARNDEGVSPWSEPGRASTETAVLSVAYGAERYPVAEGGAAEVTVVLDPPADRDVLIPVVVSPARGGLSGVPESVSFARGESERTFAVRGEPDEDDADERAVLGFGALPANVAAGTPSQAAVTVVDDDKAVAGRIERINEALLGRQAMSIVDDLNLAVQSRARALVSGEAAAARPPSLGGHSTWAGLLESNARALGEGRWDPVRLMGNSSFLLPLNAAGDACAGWRCGGTLWGTGNHHDLSGGEDGLDWDGDVLAVQIGADLQMGSNLVAGASVSWSEGSFDYRDGSDGTSGRYGSEMTSLHPYFGWASDDGLLVWGSLGVGNGDIEADEAGRARQRSDTALSAFSLGASGELMARGAAADGGRASLRLKGEATAAEVEVDGGGLIRASAVDGTRLRLGLEYGVLRTLSGNGLLDTSVEVGVRRDSGFDDGAGVEVGAGLEWTDASRGLTVGARARALAGGDHDEWGAHLSIRLAAGRDGRGASFTLRPAYGVTASGVRRLWDRGVSGPVRDRAGMEARMEAEIGYGMARWGGLFTPYGALGAGPSQRLYRAGGRFEMGARWHLDVEVEQRGGGALGADRGIRLTGQWGLGGDRTTDKAQGSTGSQPPPMRMRANRRF